MDIQEIFYILLFWKKTKPTTSEEHKKEKERWGGDGETERDETGLSAKLYKTKEETIC